jgi:hypothetical protein
MTFRDSEGDLVAYKHASEESRILFEVTIAKFDARISRAESHLEDIKVKLEDIEKKVLMAIKIIHDNIKDYTASMKKVNDLEDRLKIAECITGPLEGFGTVVSKWIFPACIGIATILTIIVTYLKLKGGH